MSSQIQGIAARLRVARGQFTLDVEFEHAGGVLVLVGPNGAGKSTLLRAILGAVPLESGRVEVSGVVLDDCERGIALPTEERRLAYLPQGHGLFPHFTVRGNLRFALRCAAPRLSKTEREDRLLGIARRFGIEALLDRAPASLSGGEQQRVALGRAFCLEPRALLLDEPLAGLDPVARRETRTYLVTALAELGIPALVVTHHEADARALARNVLAIEAGRVTQRGELAELREAPATPFVEAFFRPT